MEEALGETPKSTAGLSPADKVVLPSGRGDIDWLDDGLMLCGDDLASSFVFMSDLRPPTRMAISSVPKESVSCVDCDFWKA